MACFPLEIVTPKGTRFTGEAESLLVNTTTGQISILAGHTNYMAAVAIGKAKIVTDGKTLHAVSGNGFLSVENGKCNVLANSFDFADDIDTEKVKAELADAEALLQGAKTESDKTIAKERIKLANLRLAVTEM